MLINVEVFFYSTEIQLLSTIRTLFSSNVTYNASNQFRRNFSHIVQKLPIDICSECSTRTLTVSRLLFTQNPDARSKNSSSFDDFRANEQRIEREFESDQTNKKSTESSQSTADNSQKEKEQEKIEAVRHRILDAALSHVSSLGWSREAISAGAENCGYPGIAHGMFPNGGADLIHHFYSKCNNQLIDQLKKEHEERTDDETPPVPTEFIARAIKLRLQMIDPYIDTWPKALAVMTLPQNVPTSLAQLLTLIDDICYYAGDRSVDVSIIIHFRNLIY